MEKSKLGIAKELLAAGIFVGALAGGYVFAGLMVLYVLLKEDDQWLKEMAVIRIYCFQYRNNLRRNDHGL